MARKKSKCKVTFTGFEEILQDIEKLGGDMPQVIEKAVLKSGEIATQEYLKVVDKHRYSGITEESVVEDLKVENDGRKIVLKTGFDLKKGGLASIFLDRGVPTVKPVKYVQKIKRNKAVKGAIEETLEKEWKKLI